MKALARATALLLLISTVGAAQEPPEERFVYLQFGSYAGTKAGSSLVFGGGYAVKLFGKALLSADIGIKSVKAEIFGVTDNEITWVDLGATARYLFIPDGPFTPLIGVAFGYGPVTVDDARLRSAGITLSGSTSCLSISGVAGLRWDAGSGFAVQAEGRYMSAGFPIEGTIKENVSLTGAEGVLQVQIRL